MAEMTRDEALATAESSSSLRGDDRTAAQVLAALVRRRDAETCATCRHRAVVVEVGGPAGDPDYQNDWCCVMPDSLSVAEIEAMHAPGAVNTLCKVFGNHCGAWKAKAQP